MVQFGFQLSIDETTDVDGRYVCNLIVGFLHEDNKLFKALGEELKNLISKLPVGKIFNDAMYLLRQSRVK